MPKDLVNEKCIPCEGGVAPLSEGEAKQLLLEVGGLWHLVGGTQIMAAFGFRDFARAMQFVNKVAEIAEQEGHHPDISISYNRVELMLSTHAIKGLSKNDFILAAKINALVPMQS